MYRRLILPLFLLALLVPSAFAAEPPSAAGVSATKAAEPVIDEAESLRRRQAIDEAARNRQPPDDGEARRRSKAVDDVLAVMRIAEGSRQIERMIADKTAADTRVKRLTPAQKQDLEALRKRFCTAATFETRVQAGVAARTAAMPTDSLREFVRALDTPFVRRMQDYELAALDPGKRAGIETYEKTLAKTPPSEARLQLAQRYLKATSNRWQMNRTVASALVLFREADERLFRKYVEILEQPSVAPVLQPVDAVIGEETVLMTERISQSVTLINSGLTVAEVERQLTEGRP